MQFFGISVSIIALLLIGSISFVLFGRLTPRDRTALVQPQRKIKINDRERKYRFYSPDPDKKLPLVVMLHGYNYDSGRISELYTGWSNLAKQTGKFAVVYPEGVSRSWNGGFCCGHAYASEIEDVEFISKLVEQLDSQHSISDRYVVGFSNGSFLAQRLLNERPRLFNAGAIVMTGIGDDAGNRLDITGSNTPLAIVTGSEDPYTNHQLAKTGFRFTPAEMTLKAWAKQLRVKPETTTSKDSYTQTSYVTGDDQTKLIYRLYNEQHRWPEWRLWMFKRDVSPFTSDLWQQLQLLSQKR